MKNLLWNKDLSTMQNILKICYRVFEYLVPGGLVLWSFLIEKLIDSEVSTMTKIGCSGLCILILIVLIAVYFLKRHFNKKLNDLITKNDELTDKILLEANEEKKKLFLQEKEANLLKRKKILKNQTIFKNACFIAPFVIALVLVMLVEKGAVSARGTLTMIVSSMLVGFGFNITVEELIAKK